MTELLATVVDTRGARIWWLHTYRTLRGRILFVEVECSWYIGPLDA